MINVLLCHQIKKLSRCAKREPVFKSLDKIDKALVLFETADNNAAQVFIEQLKTMGKQAYACGYASKDKSGLPAPGCLLLHPKKDANWMGAPSKSFLNQVNSQTYDAVIDLTLNKNATMEYLLAAIPCSFKVGLNKTDYPLHDFSLSIPSRKVSDNPPLSVDYLGKQLLHYLQEIRPGKE